MATYKDSFGAKSTFSTASGPVTSAAYSRWRLMPSRFSSTASCGVGLPSLSFPGSFKGSLDRADGTA